MFTLRAIAAVAALLGCVAPCAAIVINTGNVGSLDRAYGAIVDGVDLSGVVQVSSGAGLCSGSLLSDGVSILTAGHCVVSLDPLTFTVKFMGPGGLVSESVSSVAVDPAWHGDFSTDTDLAVLHLSNSAPAFAARYGLFSGTPSMTAIDVVAGYGYGGTGASGYNGTTYPYGTLRAGTNKYGATGNWVSDDQYLLLGQMYNPADSNNTNVLHATNPYYASDAAGIAPGDSGGPTFQSGLLVGVHHQIGCLYKYVNSTDCDSPDPTLDESWGQYFEDTNVSQNITWIFQQEVVQSAPEPATWALILAGMGSLLLLRRAAAFRQTEQPVRSRVAPRLHRA